MTRKERRPDMYAKNNTRKSVSVVVGMLLAIGGIGCGTDEGFGSQLQGIYVIEDWTVSEAGGGTSSVLDAQVADMLVVQMDRPFRVLEAALCTDGDACEQAALSGAKPGAWRLNSGGDEEGWNGRQLDYAGVDDSSQCAASMARITLSRGAPGEIRIEVQHLEQAVFERATCSDEPSTSGPGFDAEPEPCIPGTCRMADAHAACRTQDCQVVEVITARFVAELPGPDAADGTPPVDDHKQPK
jgi:hypothetical protein